MSGVVVEEVTQPTDEVVEALGRLLPQLSSSSPPPTREQVVEIVESPASALLVARLEGQIVGTLTLVMFRTPTGVRAWIEDVVVDEAARGHRIGEALTLEALSRAEKAAKTVDLTSRASREAANHIYRKLGFVERDTNVYRWEPPA